ncbi:1-acyl-sn-glycerol-3-phosphate acyltransferase [Myxococcus qinghaiensis]|uniref:1-acyl-sn-glycerol-3-phosphate acyltransferase n=1 Tax=Myxococcus qinghaiensis TaxID=2906758 RepID=UPI0020A828F8|nr:1-acyl-sn-glycerol-3-phosphate acyltransferase [Myxococcus qinghaiensis]MCP3164042.1 1-acyl-sn-glycerol-3-phosphate acyltransferase [Myxococcus qinghaiensis]
MAKGVLGNDPFQRGAASRDGAKAKPGTQAKQDRSPSERGTSDDKKKTPSTRAAHASGGNGTSDKGQAKKPTRGKPAPAKSKGAPSARGAASAKASAPVKQGKAKHGQGAHAGKAPARPQEAQGQSAAKGGASTSTAKASAPDKTEAELLRVPTAAKEQSGTKRGANASATKASAPVSAEVEPLREPAAPVTPREPPPSRTPPVADPRTERTPEQREVDHALAEALAAEVAEVTAKHAVDVAMDRRDGADEPVDRLLATELATELAEAAVEEVLDHSPSTRRPERERELAATVAEQVAESAAELAVVEVMNRRDSAPHARDALEERAANNSLDEDDTQERSNLDAPHEDLAGAVLELSDLDETPDEPDDAWERSALPLSTTRSASEPEAKMPDATRDEVPPSRRGPLSLVPTSGEDHAARDASSDPDAPRPLAQRATGMLSLAREIAGQALASEGLGRAWGAMNGMLDAVRAGLGTGGGSHLDEYGKDPSLVQRLEPVLEFLYGQYWRVAAQGTDHIPRGAVILVANHSGALPYDGLVMSLTLARERPDLRESRWLVEDQIFHAPVLGTLFNRLGAVRACPENALRLLDEQRPLVVFPEGYQGLGKPFAERYRLKRFGRGGFVKLALRTGAPIVPVAIVGAEETSPLLGRIPAGFLGLPYLPLTPLGPLPAKWSIRFGEPIAMDGLPPEAAEDLGEVGRLTERTREAIQGMIHTLLRERRSVFAG